MKHYFFLLLGWTGCLHAEQFLYPVAAIDQEGQELLVVHQKSLNDIELWIWNTQTKYAYKGLLSTYIPAGIKMLPSGMGFSFIDQGRLRVKMFAKRSPRTIAMYEPISKISEIHWISDDAFYFSAQEDTVYNIFSCSTLGELHRVTASQAGDYIYPQKIGNELFCIYRLNEGFEFVNLEWALSDFEGKNVKSEKVVLLELHNAAAYLHMVSDELGFYLEYPLSVNVDQGVISFVCHRLQKVDGSWRDDALFDFKIPCEFILGTDEKRLYESVQPFLPNYTCQDLIIFMDACDYGLRLCCYNIVTGSIDVFDYAVSRFRGAQSFFAPVVVGGSVFAGVILHNDRFGSAFMRFGEIDGVWEFELPGFEL